MTSRRRDDGGRTDQAAIVAIAVALSVAAASTGVALVTDVAGRFTITLIILVPTLVASLAGTVAGRLLTSRHEEREWAAEERATAADRELQTERRRRRLLRELDRALDNVDSEHAAMDVISDAFTRHLSGTPIELHLVDKVDPILALEVATGDHPKKPGERTSPWESLAARNNTTLVYDTTDRLDLCPHLRSRLRAPVSAVAVPLNALGSLLGVLYRLGTDGDTPDPAEVTFLEDMAALLGTRLALMRSAVSAPSAIDHVDRLTGLPDRMAMQGRILKMLRDRQPFTVAVADIDNFGALNETQGREVGDRALQLVGEVARRAIRPGDVIGRIGGDEFLLVLPRTSADDATRAFERLREELVLSQAEETNPSFTLSIGVIGSSSGGTIDEILHRAAGALDHARSQGGNRVVVAHTLRESPPKG